VKRESSKRLLTVERVEAIFYGRSSPCTNGVRSMKRCIFVKRESSKRILTVERVKAIF
jgi:hypothetical protein